MGGDSSQPPQFQPRRNSSTGDAFSHRFTGRRLYKFPTGTAVEVRTNEKNFKGVCFSATVITPPKSPRKSGRKKSKKLYVEYQNLLAHEDGSDRLREYVGISFVRPPPPLLDSSKGFELDDVVDAFYKDGWWTGVVSRAVEGGERFVVTFNNPPDELEFGIAELRAHWDWVNGCWVRPQKQGIAGLMFDVGRKVEVSFDREDFQDAWFPATIHEDLGDGTFSVGYNTANTDNDGVFTPVKVDSLHIRPCPPLLKDKNFVLFEKVDAFFDLGWWSGIITKHLKNNRYLVFFKQMKCNKEFNLSELRMHMDWKDGKWFTSTQPQEPSIPFLDVPFLDDGECHHHTLENTSAVVATTPVKNSNDGEDTCVGEPHPLLLSRKGHPELLIPDVTIPMRKRRAHLSDSGDALSNPRKKLMERNLVGANKKDKHDGSKKETTSGLVSPKSLRNMETSVAQATLEENVQRKQRDNRSPQDVGETIRSIASSRRKSSAQILTLESLESDAGEKYPNTAGNTDVVTQNGHEKQETGLSVVIGLPCAETGSSGFGISGGRRSRLSKKKTFNSMDDEKQVNDSTSQKIKDGKQSVVGEETEKRKRGRRKSTEALVTGNSASRDISSGDSIRKYDDSERIREVAYIGKETSISNQKNTTANQENITNDHFAFGKRKVRVTKTMLASKHKKDNVEESVRPGLNHSWQGQKRRQISSGNISVKIRDLVVAPGGELAIVNNAVEVDKVVEPPSNKSDNEPLSKWIEEMHTSSAIDGSKLSPVVTATQCIVNGDNQSNSAVLGEASSEKQPENERQPSDLVDRGDIASTEPQILPSVNTTVGVELDEAAPKQVKSETQNISLVDKASTVASELCLHSVEETTVVASLVRDSQKQHENEARATATVDKTSLKPSQPQSSVEMTVDTALDEDNEKRPENGTALAPASVDKVSVVSSEPGKLPFVKNTILWKTIESMEVFQKIPQKPHFQPLGNSKESSREGIAIGHMVTFSSLVEKTSRLRINDPTSTMFDIKESLVELEKHGFDVKAVDDCVNQLLAMKNTEEKLVCDVSTIDNQITEHNHEKTRIESEIEEINKQIMMLQKKLSLAKLAKESKNEEIAFLLVRQRETKDSIKNVESDFNGIVSSIL